MASATKLVTASPQYATSTARLLTPKQAAEFLSVPEGTLAQWRSQHRGPAFIKLEGRLVRYRARDLERYIAGCLVETIVNGDA